MSFERTANLVRSISWPKVIGETLIVVVGVFLGIQASNWNEDRIERREIQLILSGLKPELRNNIEGFKILKAYYRVTRRYAETAFAGWRNDPRVSDRDFVIAAYQASQNTYTGTNSGSWSQIFGNDQLRNIQDGKIREDLSTLMVTDYNVMEKEIFTEYRQHVREIIPEDIQDAVRAECGDQRVGNIGYIVLPPTCRLDLPDERFRAGAKALRDHPELVGQLRWHFAAVASYLSNIDNLQTITTRLLKRIEAAS